MRIIRVAVTVFLLISSLTSCDETFQVESEIAFVVEDHCVGEVVAFFEMLQATEPFKTRLVPTNEVQSMFDSIKHVGIIQSSKDLDLSSYANGAKRNCGSRRIGIFTFNGPVSLDPYVYRKSKEKNKVIYVEVNGDNAKVYE